MMTLKTWLVLGRDFLPVPQIDSYLRYLHSVGKSPNTIRSYAYHLKEFWLFLTACTTVGSGFFE
ncbi:site-specific integrase [Aeromonas caviae]|uniref:Site-specific integrase n=1 Tax=Aeromonas caviae TaxID=648 RepID=A0A7T3X2D5_AERCA|nr:site-specific integrase [Aeromonas caviae]